MHTFHCTYSSALVKVLWDICSRISTPVLNPAGLSDEWDEIWVELQNEWAQISSRSTHIIADESGHFIQLDQPDLVIDAILQVVEDARGDLR